MICNPLLKDCTQVSNPSRYTSNVVQTGISLLFVIAVIYFVWHFILAAYRFMTAEGDDKKISQAKTDITDIVTGLVIVFIVFALLKLIGTVFGIPSLNTLQLTLPSL